MDAPTHRTILAESILSAKLVSCGANLVFSAALTFGTGFASCVSILGTAPVLGVSRLGIVLSSLLSIPDIEI